MMGMRTVTFKIEDSLLELLDQYAIKNKIDRSTAIRRAIEKLLREEFTKDNENLRIKIEKISLK